jgi:nucleoid DNA-binding protein
MKKQQFAARLARHERLSPSAAADQLDRVIHDILKRLKKGEAVPLPGLGTFLPGRRPAFRFEPRNTPKGPAGGAQ